MTRFALVCLAILAFSNAIILPAKAGQVTSDDVMKNQMPQEELFKTLEPAQLEFVKAYLAARFSSDTKAQQALLHPDTLACLKKNNQLDSIYQQRNTAVIDKSAKIAFLKGSKYKQAGQFLSENLYTFAIGNAWFEDIKSYTTLVIAVVKENDKYYEIIPCA